MKGSWAGKAAGAFTLTGPESDVSTATVMAKIVEFLGQFITDTDIDPDLNLFESGLVTSLFAMQLLLYVEQEFAIQVTNEDLDVKNFHSLNAVTDFVMRKIAASA